jgi:Tol biopolymer transport system component
VAKLHNNHLLSNTIKSVLFFLFLFILASCNGPAPTKTETSPTVLPKSNESNLPTQTPISLSATQIVIAPPPLTGTVVFHRQAGNSNQIFTVDLSTGGTTQLTTDGDNVEPSWSPYGKQIAYASDQGEKFELWLMNADGSDKRQLTHNDFNDWSANWSPDGNELVYVSSEVPYSHIYILDIASGKSTRVLDTPGNEGAPKWSPDGSKIIYMNDNEGYFNLFTVKPDGTDIVQVTDFGQDDRPNWSADGKKITFRRQTVFSTMFSGAEIFVSDADGKNPLQLTNNTTGDDWPAFSPDGKWIVYTTTWASESYLQILPVGGGTPATLIPGSIIGRAPDWKP